MPTPTDIFAGTISLTNGSDAFTGTGTAFAASLLQNGDTIVFIEGGETWAPPIIEAIASNTAGTLTEPWAGPTLTNVRYRIRYQWDSARVGALARNLADQLDNGNIQALSLLTGPGVPVFNGPHSMTIKPETDFINGVAYNVQVDTLADRTAYDGQTEGFAVLVSDVGTAFGPDNDGRSAVFSKVSNTSGDWTDPAYVTGPIGAMPDIEATVTPLPPSGTANVNVTPIAGGYSFEFELPASPGFYWESVYNSANVYAKDSVVRRNGSSFIAVQDVPAGTQPSGATPPVDTAFWEIIAAKGNDGAGTVTALGEGDGIDIDATDPTMPIISVNMAELDAFTGDAGSGGVKGVVPAPVAGDAAANKFLNANGDWRAPFNPIPVTNWNSISTPGAYCSTNPGTDTNQPPVNGWFIGRFEMFPTGYGYLEVTDAVAGAAANTLSYGRYRNSAGVWGSWFKVLRSQDDVGWKSLVQPTVAVAALVIPVRAGLSAVRISGLVKTSVLAVPTRLRLSVDGGATYISSASYVASGLYQVGASVSGVASAAATNFVFAFENNDAALGSQVEAAIDCATGLFPRFRTWGTAYGGTSAVQSHYHGWCNAATSLVTHLQIYPDSGNIAVGTKLQIEGF